MMICPLLIAAASLAQTTGDAPPAPTPSPSSPFRPLAIGASTYFDIEVGAGVSTNPLLQVGNEEARAFGRFSLHAVHSRLSERSSTVLTAYGENTAYLGRYGSRLAGRINASHDVSVTERLTLFGNVYASTDRGDQLGARIVDVPTLPETTPITSPLLPGQITDVSTLFGRNYNLGARLGARTSLSPRDGLSLIAGFDQGYFRSRTIDRDYSSVSAAGTWDRRLNERTVVGAQITATRSSYDNAADSYVITPQVTANLLLSETTNLSGAVGLSFARYDFGTEERTSTGLAVNTRLCRRGEQDRLCAQVSRQEQAATSAGPVRSLAAAVDYSRALSEHSSLSVAVAANRDSTAGVVDDPNFSSRASYYRASSRYTRRLADRLFGGAEAAARKYSIAGEDPKPDFQVSLFGRYRLGDDR